MEPTRHEFIFQGPQAKAVFYALTFLSLGLMLWQLWQTRARWLTGKPVDWRGAGWDGLKTFVFSQRKVRGSRVRDGAPLHLAVFYGFLGLFLATSLLGLATYAPLLGMQNWHRGTYYLVFEFLADLAGLLFLLGVLWAFWRRFVASRTRETPLTTEPKDWAALGLLLALAITGFKLEGARIALQPGGGDSWSFVGNVVALFFRDNPPVVYVTLWWIHAVLVWAFFLFLPQMRLRHVVVACFSAAGAPDWPMGRLRPVSLEEVEQTGLVGAKLATDFSQWHLTSLDACMSCGRCTEVCPAHGAGKALNPKRVVADVQRALLDGTEVTPLVTEESLWACTTCNACVEACPVLIRHVDLIVDLRRDQVAEGKLAGSAATVLRQIGSTGHAWGQPANSREDWMKGLDVPLCRDGARFEYLFWVGCAGATEPAAIRTTQAVAKLLKKAGVSFACLGREEACTGDPARRIGDEFTFAEQAGKNVGVFGKYGVSKVVTTCPHCLNTLLNEYGDFGAQLDVVHHTQLLAELVGGGRLRAAAPTRPVTYHDPCYLARVNGVVDAPRRLFGEESAREGVSAFAEEWTSPLTPLRVLREPEHSGVKTLCCGAGGGRMWMEEEPGKRPSDRRVQELLATGAQDIAVACPFCRVMLDTGLKQDASTVRLIDIAELLQESN